LQYSDVVIQNNDNNIRYNILTIITIVKYASTSVKIVFFFVQRDRDYFEASIDIRCEQT